jgi:hypothetical protein
MTLRSMFFAALMAGIGAACLSASTDVMAQSRTLTEAECRDVRERLTGHARLSEGVRRDLANRSRGPSVTQPPMAAGSVPPPGGRSEAIRDRLERIQEERQWLKDTRLSSFLRYEIRRATELTRQIKALGTEKANLENELAGLPARVPGAPTAPAVLAKPGLASEMDHVPCQDATAALDAAVRIRRRELGAKEEQAGVIPLVSIRGQNGDQIVQELANQFAAWPEAAHQVGLLDQEGKGRADAFVDVPATNIFRLFRRRADGTLTLDVYSLPGRPGGQAYGDMSRRLDEAAILRNGLSLDEMLAIRPAGPVRVVGETAEFARLQAFVLAGNYGEAARVEGGGTRAIEFQNLRGETIRVVEMVSPVPNGQILRRVVATARPNGEERWEETTTILRPVSDWRTEVEVRGTTEIRSATGYSLEPRSASAPVAFVVDR